MITPPVAVRAPPSRAGFAAHHERRKMHMSRRTTMRWLACWSLLLASVFAAHADPLGQCGTCATTFECTEGLKCIGARCRTDGQCCLDEDCPTGQSCQDHQCRITASEVGQCGECSTSFQCANDLKCVGARCKSDGQCCFDPDCPAGQSCQNHQCRITGGDVGLCGACSTSFECANDLNCVGARCKDPGQCCLDQDCPSGQACLQNRCATPSPPNHTVPGAEPE